MSTTSHYLVTPEKGRVGHSRQVAPFRVWCPTLPTNIGELETAIRKHVWGMCRDRHTAVKVSLPPDTSDFACVVTGRDGIVHAKLQIEVIDE